MDYKVKDPLAVTNFMSHLFQKFFFFLFSRNVYCRQVTVLSFEEINVISVFRMFYSENLTSGTRPSLPKHVEISSVTFSFKTARNLL